jgi:hypothetical protein
MVSSSGCPKYMMNFLKEEFLSSLRISGLPEPSKYNRRNQMGMEVYHES